MKILIIVFVSALSFSARADVATDFSYQNARKAFQNQRTVPSATDLATPWIKVGMVDSEGRFGKHGEYHADGWNNYSKSAGHYREVRQFRSLGVNPFGQAEYSSQVTLIDQATSKVFRTYQEQTFDSSMISVISTSSSSKNSTTCGLTEECHLLSNGLLLCGTRNTGPSFCEKDGTVYYDGWLHEENLGKMVELGLLDTSMLDAELSATEFSSQNRGRFCPVGTEKRECRIAHGGPGGTARYVTHCLAPREKCPSY
jgi:hypothetical protein